MYIAHGCTENLYTVPQQSTVLGTPGVHTRRMRLLSFTFLRSSINVVGRSYKWGKKALALAHASSPHEEVLGRLEASSPGVPHRKTGIAWHEEGAARARRSERRQ